MRKAITTLVALGMLMPAAVQAQSANATVGATATVLAYLDVTKVTDVDFGSINPGAAANLTPGVAPGSGQLGILQMDHNSDVSVSVSLPVGGLLLDGGAPGDLLPATFSCGYSVAAAGALDGAAVPVACTALANRSGNGDGTTRTSYVQIGGDISSADTTNRLPGTYRGDLVFTVNALY